jgi:hypothetical protein
LISQSRGLGDVYKRQHMEKVECIEALAQVEPQNMVQWV